MLLRKGLKEHVPLQKYHSHIKKNDIELKLQRLYFYDESQCDTNQTNTNIESAYSINNALLSEFKNMLSHRAWM